jgi:hypothetical protein
MFSRMDARKVVGFTLLFTVVLLSCVTFVNAQYTTEKTTQIAIPDSGIFTASEPNVGVSYEITGAPGATGSVTATVYNGNPQADATVPVNVTLTRFVVVTFDFSSQNFMKAILTFNYSDADVANLQAPYAVYKYMPDTNSYVELAGVVDSVAKTITITVTSIDDPLFAIGGASVAAATTTSPDQTLTWVAVAAVVIIVLIMGLLAIKRYRS